MKRTTTLAKSCATDMQVRWLITRDLPAVLDIELAEFQHPWSEGDFRTVLREKNVIGMVAERNERIFGYMVYRLEKDVILLLNFAVDGIFHRQGIGRQMIDILKLKLSQQRRKRIEDLVRETNLPMQLFLRAQGFRCCGDDRNAFENGESSYQFVWELPQC